MSITGHKTEDIFERYNIKTVDDRNVAQAKQAANGRVKPSKNVTLAMIVETFEM